MEQQDTEKPTSKGGSVFRSIAFPVSTFDYLKDYQRKYEAMYGVRLTNNQALTIMLGEHKTLTEEREDHEQHNSSTSRV